MINAKKNKIYDTFMFCDELEILKIRLNILDDFVDYFVICESEEGFRGNKKPLYYEKNKDVFKKWHHKIFHLIISDYPEDFQILDKAYKSPNTGINQKDHWWIREFYQKEFMMNALKLCQDDDIVFVSDIDEIWNPLKINFQIEDNKVYRPIQTAYPFFLNNKSDQHFDGWVGTRYGKYKVLKKYGINHFRTEREIKSELIADAGWHFSWIGKKDWDKWNDGHPGNEQNYSVIMKTKMIKDETNLPQYILDNKNLFVEKKIMLP